MALDSYRLGVDFGTSSTVAALQGADGRVRPLLFDSSPLLSSAVFVGPDGTPLTGADAERAGLAYASGLEPNPKRRIDDGTLWLGEREIGIAELITVVLRRVAEEAYRVTGGTPESTTITRPAAWGQARLSVLAAAAGGAGLGRVEFVPEPVAAAAYFVRVLGHNLPADRCLVVYDFGAGTFDVSVVRPAGPGFTVVASAGLPDVGGLDLDATIVAHARASTGQAVEAWNRLDWPQTPADQQARHALWRGAKAAKEQLSRHPAADLHVPLAGADVRVTREEFEKLASPLLDRTSALTLSVLREAAVAPESVGGVFLVGGSSRIPLAATLLHRTLRIAPTALDYPELVVAEGALHAAVAEPPTVTLTPGPSAPRSPALPPTAHFAAPASAPTSGATGPPTVPPPPAARKWRRRAIVLGGVAAVVVVALAATLLVLRPWVQKPITGATLTATFKGHTDAVNAVAFSPDGKLLASAGKDKSVRFWNVEERTKDDDYNLTDFTYGPDVVAFNRDGNRLVTRDSSSIQVWDVAKRRNALINDDELDTETGLSSAGPLGNIGFTSDGKKIQAAFTYGAVATWNTSDGKRADTYPAVAGPEKVFSAATVSPDGSKLAAEASADGLRIYDVKKKSFVGPLKGEDDGGTFSRLRFSPDGKLLAATNSYDDTLVVFDLATGKPIGPDFEGHTAEVDALVFSPDSKVIASAGVDNRILLWDVAGQSQIGAPLKGPKARTGDDANAITGLAFSGDGKHLASANTDRTVMLWRVDRG